MLTSLDLIDEFAIVVHPVVLGGGKPLLPIPKDRVNLELIESRIFDSRTVLLHYGIGSSLTQA